MTIKGGIDLSERPSTWQIADSRGRDWPDTLPNLERSAVYILLRRDRGPRGWGNKEAPPGAIHHKRILSDLGIDDEVEGTQNYHALKRDVEHFVNPRQGKVACYALTAEGERWANELLKEARSGTKPWLLDWEDQHSAGRLRGR